ncbi:hypothetical protein [Actinomyces trachealis]|uniref:hypothetical protein n=1 Tax=Actinomyces trachealis TaxID=2763540 RepID=UPI0039A6054F
MLDGTASPTGAEAGTKAGTSSPRSPEEACQGAVVDDLSTALAWAQERLAEVTRQRDMLVDLLERSLTPEQLREMARSVDVSMVESVFRLVARADGYARDAGRGAAPGRGHRAVAALTRPRVACV